MLTIISGVPGSGKTGLVVDMIMQELKQGRKVFTFGIPDLVLNTHPAGDLHEWQAGTWLQIDHYNPELTKAKGIDSTWFPRGCPETCEFLSTCPRVGQKQPDSGALIVIDEAHVHFPQRSSGKAPPDFIEALTVHRHPGLDIWFLSQRPSFLDPFVRGLASRHIHLSLNPFSWGGKRIKYQWAEYQETVNRTSKMLAAKSNYLPMPHVFPLYKSATVHTKLDQRMPTIMKMFILCVLILALMVGAAVYRVKQHVNQIQEQNAPVSAAPAPAPKVVQAAVSPSSAAQPTNGGGQGGERSAHPPGAGVGEAAKPSRMDYCVRYGKTCRCFSGHQPVIADCTAIFSGQVELAFVPGMVGSQIGAAALNSPLGSGAPSLGSSEASPSLALK